MASFSSTMFSRSVDFIHSSLSSCSRIRLYDIGNQLSIGSSSSSTIVLGLGFSQSDMIELLESGNFTAVVQHVSMGGFSRSSWFFAFRFQLR